MNMSRVRGILLTLTLATLVAGQAALAQTQRINLNHEMVGTVADDALRRMAEAVRERSDGRLQIEVHSRAELGSERQMFDLMQVGGIEMGLTGSAIISAVAPEYGALDMPYLITSVEHLRRVHDGPIGQELDEKILENKGIRVLGSMDRDPRHLTTGNREVRTPEDLRGLKIRVREIPVQVAAFRALGANPVPMAFGEVYTALQTGTMDAQENPLSIIAGASFDEVQDYVILTGHVREMQRVIVSEVWWQTLPEEDQQLISDAVTEFMEWGREQVYVAEEELRKELEERGMTFVELSPEELQRFQEGVSSVPEQFSDVWLPELYERVVEANP